ncbi:MAG: (d)CMP kinase [Culicoidibacterales bacterium]
MKKPNIIAIDGPASSGKGTIAKKIASNLGYIYLDTGAMYRALTYFCLEEDVDMSVESDVLEAARKINISFTAAGKTEVNGLDVSEQIRTPEVSSLVSLVISLMPKVRALMVEKQQKFGEEMNAVIDGRDIATVVFPRATVKLFISASLETRARRRYEQNLANGMTDSYKEVKGALAQRDKMDLTRKISPLVKATDAIVIDSTNQNVEQTLAVALDCIKRKVEHN